MAEPRMALIIGGGIAGMSAAIALRRSGLIVELIDRVQEWRVFGAGLAITGPTLRAMGRLGILDDVLRQGFAADGIDVCSAAGKLMFNIDTRDQAFGDTPSTAGILRSVLHKIMLDGLMALNPTIRLGVTAEKIELNDGKSDVLFSDGSTGSYDLVVGADGIYSQTRQDLFPDAPQPLYAGQYCWRLMMERHAGIERRTFFLGGPAKVGLNPVSRDAMYMFFLEAQSEPVWREEKDQPEILKSLLDGYGGVLRDIRARIDHRSNIVCRPLETVLAGKTWVRGNVVLIGDAAHATTPQLASGAGMGIEDGLVLGEEMARHNDVETALASFMKRRYGRCKLVVDSSLEINRLEQERSPPHLQTEVVERALAALKEEF